MWCEMIGLLIGFVGVIVLNLGSGLFGLWIGVFVLIIVVMCWVFGLVWSCC